MAGLDQSKLFSSLPPGELRPLEASCTTRDVEAGAEIFKEGDPGDGMYVILNGQVQISALVAEGDRRVLGSFGEGDFFGEMAVLDQEPRSATATATTKSKLCFIPRESMLKMLESSPPLATRLVREFSLRMRDFNRRYVQEVLQAERLTLVGRFARSIVHDFKNPLNVIGLAADLVKMEKATPEMRIKASNRIRAQVDRLSGMISELLEFTRGSAAHAIVPEPVPFSAFIERMIGDLRPEAQDKRVALVLRNQPTNRVALMDQKRMQHVLANLIHNAADVMPNGGSIFFSFEDRDGQVITHMEDTGPGIAEEIMPRLFETFATFGKSNGTGLGLSICKRIIEDHKGWIRARNQSGGGAIFSFGIPLS